MRNNEENLFNCALFPNIINNYELNENESEIVTNNDREENSIIYEDIKPFINSFLCDIDSIKPEVWDERNENIIDENNNPFSENKRNINNKKRKNKKKKKIKKLKNYNIRKGDWLCPDCNNINFHFRTICNICKRNKD